MEIPFCPLYAPVPFISRGAAWGQIFGEEAGAIGEEIGPRNGPPAPDFDNLPPTEANSTRGWKVGDPINNLTSSGKVPSWSAVRKRYWKNQAALNPTKYDSENLARMQEGNAPQRFNETTRVWESMELDHTPPQRTGGLFDVQPVWPDEHAAVDPFRKTGK